MNDDLDLIFLIDRSGSMCGSEQDTIGGFNSMISNQKEVEGQCFVSTVLFNTNQKVIHDRENLENINNIDSKFFVLNKLFWPGGSAG